MLTKTKTLKQLRESLTDQLDPKLFHPDIYVICTLILGLVTYLMFFYLAFQYGGFFYLLVIPMGVLIQVLSNVNHEILHWNVVKSQAFGYALTMPSMFLNMTSPHFWVHTHLHHHRLLDIWTFKERTVNPEKVAPEPKALFGLSKFLFTLDFFLLNSIHYRFRPIGFLKERGLKTILKDSNLLWILIETLLILLAKIALFYYLGLSKWILLELIPFLIFSFISSCFFVTSHSPAFGHTERKSIRIYTVRTNKFIDELFFHLGYHVEHHLFPSIPQKHLPVVARFLEEKELYPDHKFNHLDAIKKTYTHALKTNPVNNNE